MKKITFCAEKLKQAELDTLPYEKQWYNSNLQYGQEGAFNRGVGSLKNFSAF